MNQSTKASFRRGARIRRNSSLRVVNSIFMGYRNFLMVDSDSCLRNTNDPALLALVTPGTPVDVQTKQISFANNLIVNTDAAFPNAADTVANGLVEVTRAKGSLAKLQALDAWIKLSGPLANNIDPAPFTTGVVVINPLAASTTPDFRPVAGSPALGGANFTDNSIILPSVVSNPGDGVCPDRSDLSEPNHQRQAVLRPPGGFLWHFRCEGPVGAVWPSGRSRQHRRFCCRYLFH